MAMTNAQRQAEWRKRRKQELESLRNDGAGISGALTNLTADELKFLQQQLVEYRARIAVRQGAGNRFEALQSVMRQKLVVDQIKEHEKRASARKLKPVHALNRDLFD